MIFIYFASRRALILFPFWIILSRVKKTVRKKDLTRLFSIEGNNGILRETKTRSCNFYGFYHQNNGRLYEQDITLKRQSHGLEGFLGSSLSVKSPLIWCVTRTKLTPLGKSILNYTLAFNTELHQSCTFCDSTQYKVTSYFYLYSLLPSDYFIELSDARVLRWRMEGGKYIRKRLREHS